MKISATLETPAVIAGRVSLFDSFEEGLAGLRSELERARGPYILSFINAHGFNLCHTDPVFLQSLLRSDMILRDGAGMSLLYKAMGQAPAQNFCGTDFIPYVLEHLAGKRVALLGTQAPYLERAAAVLAKRGVDVVHLEHGFLEAGEYVAQLRSVRPDVVVLGMGNPKQEKVAAILKEQLDFPCLLISGGAIIDYLGEKVSRAPLWMRRAGLEWVYRLRLEPRRMFRRYIIGNVLFLLRVAELRFRWARG
ncbi:WecB/TagA/CpsF family glycosyltransferase [Flaviaesturariibacter amylovorans]|uniref:WecB/TagA/CpsF family glycosyltransferase n=1 Tax=Flaviaesturariibacter amylovorans TaxID=1084520 RepID=A0ABP8GS61_9BACT